MTSRLGGSFVAPAALPLAGATEVPGDKSISHRALLVAALAEGTSAIRGFSPAGDCWATLGALAALGVKAEEVAGDVVVEGRGPDALSLPTAKIDCRRSGTTMRLLAGVLAAAPFRSILTGDDQLLGRPMERVAEPLRRMGAGVRTAEGGLPPLVIDGGPLRGIRYRLPVASAQVKSAILLAGLRADGETVVAEPVPTRDHIERLLEWAGVAVARDESDGEVRIVLRPGRPNPVDLEVPGDPSAAAPLLAAAALVPGSDVVVRGVGLNSTRTGFLQVLRRMGAEVEERRSRERPEPVGDVHVRFAPLRGTSVGPEEVPSLIDELPLVGVLATRAEGVTEVRGAAELRVKESDRIEALVRGLRAVGARAEELPDGFVVRGPTRLRGGACDARADHRLAMALALTGLVATDPVRVDGMQYVGDSFPGFLERLEGLR